MLLKRTLASFIFCVCVWPCLSMATIYKWVDKNGNSHFTDKPTPGASKVKLMPIQTYQPIEAPSFEHSKRKAKTKPKQQGYSSIKIAQPKNGQTFRDNQGMVPINLVLDPSLNVDAGHQIQIKLNGVVMGKPRTTTEFTLYHVNRGTHTLEAEIVDAHGKVLGKSPQVHFFMHRTVAHLHKIPAKSLKPAPTPSLPLSAPVT